MHKIEVSKVGYQIITCHFSAQYEIEDSREQLELEDV